MLKLFVLLQNLRSDERGVTAIEYAVLAGAVAAGLVAVFGTADSGVLAELKTVITDAINQTAASGTGG